MGALANWLLHDDQKELFDYLFAVTLNAVFLGLIALALWPLGEAAFALSLAKGFWLFWIVVTEAALVLAVFQRVFRVDIDSHFDAYVISALAVSCSVQAGWSAFAALAARGAAAGATFLTGAALYAVGLLSCFVAFQIVAAFYGGSIYRVVNFFLAAVSFVLFAIWPAAARALYGWSFDLLAAAARALYGWFFNLF